MFSKEYRSLKRPRLGVPDYYPQDSKQKEVLLLDCCFRLTIHACFQLSYRMSCLSLA